MASIAQTLASLGYLAYRWLYLDEISGVERRAPGDRKSKSHCSNYQKKGSTERKEENHAAKGPKSPKENVLGN